MGVDFRALQTADRALRLAQDAHNAIAVLTQTLATIVTTTGPAAMLSIMQGTSSPEGVITGLVPFQQYFQYNIDGDVIATWRFEGTIGQNTGWVEV